MKSLMIKKWGGCHLLMALYSIVPYCHALLRLVSFSKQLSNRQIQYTFIPVKILVSKCSTWWVNAHLAHPSPTALHLDELSRVRDSRFSLFSTLAGVCFYRQAWSTNTISISSVNLSKNSRISVQDMIKPKYKKWRPI